MRKRIVLLATKGLYSDIEQIVGTDDQLPEGLPPTFIPEVAFLDHTGPVSLVRVTPRAIYYREVITPTEATERAFHPSQE